MAAGLSFIGLVLQTCERKIADYWGAYEGKDEKDLVVIKYPEQYSLKSNLERIEEADKLADLMFSIPSRTAKKELAKDASSVLMGGRITPEVMDRIFKEIDAATYSTSNPDVIQLAKDAGLASDVTLSNALGFDGAKEVPKAQEDHSKRIARIQLAQSTLPLDGARGVDDKAVLRDEGKIERNVANDNTLRDSTKDRSRGKAKKRGKNANK